MTVENYSTLKSLCMTDGDYLTHIFMGNETFMIVQDGDEVSKDVVILTRKQVATMARAILKAVGDD